MMKSVQCITSSENLLICSISLFQLLIKMYFYFMKIIGFNHMNCTSSCLTRIIMHNLFSDIINSD